MSSSPRTAASSPPPSASSSGKPPGLGIALGGGGMKGWAHVGVLSVLERLGLKPDVLAGCSAGALVGAYYAYGYSIAEMQQFMREQQTSSLFSLRLDGLGLLSTDAFREYLREHLGDCTFADLKIPYYVVATDLETGREVVLNRGPVVEALLASSAMPGIFAPVRHHGRLLIDGGLSNNLPVSALVAHGARYTVGVRLHADEDPLHPKPLARTPRDVAEKRVSFSMWADRLTRSFRKDEADLPNGLEVVGRVMELVVAKLELARLHAYPPDVLISPDLAHINVLSLSEEKEDIFRVGVHVAEGAQPALERLAYLLQADRRAAGTGT